MPELEPEAFSVVLPGTPVPEAPILVAGPGTGFGVSTLIPSAGGWTVLAGEGGHMAYAPRTDLERKLAGLLARERARRAVALIRTKQHSLDEVAAAAAHHSVGRRVAPIRAALSACAWPDGECQPP